MPERFYEIQMQTPMGVKHGKIQAKIRQDGLSGYLDIMNHSEPFYGLIYKDGACVFSGKIITLMNTIEYEAVGKMDEHTISLELYGKNTVFRITGSAVLACPE